METLQEIPNQIYTFTDYRNKKLVLEIDNFYLNNYFCNYTGRIKKTNILQKINFQFDRIIMAQKANKLLEIDISWQPVNYKVKSVQKTSEMWRLGGYGKSGAQFAFMQQTAFGFSSPFFVDAENRKPISLGFDIHIFGKNDDPKFGDNIYDYLFMQNYGYGVFVYFAPEKFIDLGKKLTLRPIKSKVSV